MYMYVDSHEELMQLTRSDDLSEIFQLLDYDDSGSVQIDEFLVGILKASTRSHVCVHK